jgi:hypothetical protein
MKQNLKLSYVILLNVLIMGFFVFKIGLFLKTLGVEDLVDSYRVWFEHQKWFLTSIMVLFFISSFAITRLKENIIISFALGYYLTFGWVLQDYAYDFFVAIKFSTLINYPRFDNNPEFANMSVAVVGLFVLGCSLVFSLYRLRKIMIFLYGVLLLSIIFFVHQIGPTSLIRSERADRVKTLETMIATTKRYEDALDRCKILGCLVFEHSFYEKPRFNFPPELNFIRPVEQIEAFRLQDSGKILEFAPVFNAERNPILLGASRIEGETVLFVDSDYPDKLWKRQKGNFSGIIALAILMWTFILYFVVEIHHVNHLKRLRKISSGRETDYQI